MNRRSIELCFHTILPSLLDDLIFSIDQALGFVYKFIELPLQNVFSYFGNIKLWTYRRRSSFEYLNNLTELLYQSCAITFSLYFIFLFFGYIYSTAIQRYYFIDTLLSNNRQCINIQFIKNDKFQYNNEHIRLKNNFIQENIIITNQSQQQNDDIHYNYNQFDNLLNLLDNYHYIICQRSLYLYSRFQTYSSLLHSNHSQFRFFISAYPSSFTIDRPPFIDLCIHASNHSDLEQIKSHLRPLASNYYSSVNLYLFNFNFTQVSVTLYELNKDSLHLERVSIHTGWLYDIYSKYYFFKYNHALSTVLFDGLSKEQHYIDYFHYKYIPVPSDPLLGLNEMVQQAILVLPLCQSSSNI